MEKDAIIVLSHWLKPDRSLSEESVLRIDRGIELLDRKVARYLIMNGGPGRFTEELNNELIPRGTRPVHCEVMRDYAVSKGVPLELILMQDYSSDTIGEAYFVNELILKPRGFNNNVVVTSDYHGDRVRKIYDLVFGDGYNTKLKLAKTQLWENMLEWEERNMKYFLQHFEGVTRGDAKAIERILYEKHDIYSKIPVEQRLIFYPEVHKIN